MNAEESKPTPPGRVLLIGGPHDGRRLNVHHFPRFIQIEGAADAIFDDENVDKQNHYRRGLGTSDNHFRIYYHVSIELSPSFKKLLCGFRQTDDNSPTDSSREGWS
jgi:hypothetical protein